MTESIEKLNKQIASFILLSAALTTQVAAADFAGNMIPVNSDIHQVISMYAVPEIPHVKPTPVIIHEPPVISLYAAPQFPIHEIHHPVMPIAEPVIEKIPVQKIAPALNEPSLNINNNPANINKINNNLNNIDKIDKNTDKINYNAGKNINVLDNAQSQSFITTDFGNIKVIEPYMHFVFR